MVLAIYKILIKISCAFITVSYSPTDAQVNCRKYNIKIYIKTTPTCFGANTSSSGSALIVIAKVTVVKIVN